MLDIMERFNKGEDIRIDLRVLLDHEDYKIQFGFFADHWANIGFTKEEYIEFFVNIRNIRPESVTSNALKYRINDLLHIMDNIDYYREIYYRISCINKNALQEAIRKAKLGLVEEISFSDIKLIFAIGLGVTGGFRYKKYAFFDLKNTLGSKSNQGVINTIAHELYHVGYYTLYGGADEVKQDKNKDYMLAYLLGQEGCAVKYANNVEGILTKKIYESQEQTIEQQSYDYYLFNFEKIYTRFKNDIKDIRSSDLVNYEDIEDIFIRNYLNRDVIINGELKKFYLRNPLTYYLGADIWGVIHDVFGRDMVRNLLIDPTEFFVVFNKALSIIGRDDLCINIT